VKAAPHPSQPEKTSAKPVPLPTKPLVAAKQPASAAASATTAKPTGATPPQRDQKPASAVVLDEASPRAAQPVHAAAPQGAPPASNSGRDAPRVVALATPATAAAAVSTPAKPALQRGKGLIAITPDGKVAVFTNPTTKLPQQFKIGDHLTSGDTVLSIDAKAGKVISSSKEYSLD
jgi:hypothetical protein